MNQEDGEAWAPLLAVSSDAGDMQVLGPCSMRLLSQSQIEPGSIRKGLLPGLDSLNHFINTPVAPDFSAAQFPSRFSSPLVSLSQVPFQAPEMLIRLLLAGPYGQVL